MINPEASTCNPALKVDMEDVLAFTMKGLTFLLAHWHWASGILV